MREPHILGVHDPNTLEQLNEVNKFAMKTALMADGHRGYGMPIGGVGAFDNKVSPAYVGYDIGCGNNAVLLDMMGSDLDAELVADLITKNLVFGAGGVNNHPRAPNSHPLFDDDRWDIFPDNHRGKLHKKAREQIGTIGAGNHYVDVFIDELDRVWVGAHFGSRRFGYDICSNFLALIVGSEWGEQVKKEQVGTGLVSLTDPIGRDYWTAMTLAGEYAQIGRKWVVDLVAKLLGAKVLDHVYNHHNYAWVEHLWMEDTLTPMPCVVIRKGATGARPGQRGFVGGSMCDVSVILQGTPFPKSPEYTHEMSKDEKEDSLAIFSRQQQTLFSAVHGAGRVMGRMQALGKPNKAEGGWKREPKVTQDMMDRSVAEAGIVLRGGDRDESPQVYRRLSDVLAAQGDTIQVLHTLTPKVVCMAPKGGR
ncbi:MAG: RtcB family protein [Bacteroidales bacterium]|nr:RtcB family protein [Candidatus Latescibacterota bacterium]